MALILTFYHHLHNIDLLNIVLLGLAEDLPEKTEEYELHRLLGALLSSKLKVDEKLDIIGNEFDIPFDREHLAGYLNVERSALSNELGKMKREGLIDFKKNHFVINQEAFEASM